MSFPLGSLRGEGAGESVAASARAAAPSVPWRRKAWLFVGGLAWLLWLLAMVTHDAADPAFTTSGGSEAVQNRVGVLGARVADLAYFLFGFSCWWLLPVGLRAWLSSLAAVLRHDAPAPVTPRWRFWLGLVLLLAASCALEWTRLYRFEAHLNGHAGGVLGWALGPLSMRWLGFAGSGVLWIALGVAGASMALRFSWLGVAETIGRRFDALRERLQGRREQAEDRRLGEMAAREREQQVEVEKRREDAEPAPLVIAPPAPEIPKSQRVARERQQPLFAELADNKLPQVDLLDAVPAAGREPSVTAESLEMTSRLIEKKLRDFGVEVHVVAASPGPVITRYEIEPATGVKGAQIVNLARDLARSLSLVSIRVVEVVPGKTTMALELPNARRQAIRLSEILGSEVYNASPSLLTIGLGKDIVGNPVVADLAKMPHCLVAGTTGSGKSVGINAMILSLLYKAEARDVRLILIDPKMLEMSVYEGIPHLLAPVVTDMKQAANALAWCVGEMERRYKLMSKLGVRNLSGYNRKVADAVEAGQPLGNPFSLTPDAPEPLERLPQIVVIIDELADLMMVIGKKIEELIARLAQKARAAGIHLVLATQRPSVDVITGLIKANIPTRLSFQVASKIDSRTILDQMGAEALLGQGDMLYLASGTGMPVRVHGAFVSDEEVHRVVEYLKAHGEPNYIEGILEGGVLDGDETGGGAGEGGSGEGESDPMYDQAVEVVLQHRRASISLVQRHLRIGYNRAARLLEQMERSGLVSAMATNGNRDILVPKREE
ncbi:MAG: DNA translocase FtsK 4TM domain-containing protein [Betaproteobacteria bacterium]|nr:DNA translocase FtsK 4TM domain-containing protein [Betaproteobacteria bacterium]MCC6248796.1 DNA translocase FtsK 4TM domain-containing protein [Rubrivivax sp.]